MGTRYFTPRLFSFLRELAAHNDREWFAVHREGYERHVREQALRFITDAAPALADLAPHFVADPRKVGGSLLRIQRDVRFSADKGPYRTYLGIHFRHAQWKETHTPSIYLALRPRGSYLGMGSWRPDGETIRAIRRAIADRVDIWEKATGAEAFGEVFTLVGDELKRPPRGFDAAHPLIDDLRRKDFAAAASLSQTQIASDDFLGRLIDYSGGRSPSSSSCARRKGFPSRSPVVGCSTTGYDCGYEAWHSGLVVERPLTAPRAITPHDAAGAIRRFSRIRTKPGVTDSEQ